MLHMVVTTQVVQEIPLLSQVFLHLVFATLKIGFHVNQQDFLLVTLQPTLNMLPSSKQLIVISLLQLLSDQTKTNTNKKKK